MSPSSTRVTVRLENGAIALTATASGSDDVVIRRKFEVLPARGQRLRLKARVRTEAPAESFARATMKAITSASAPSYRDLGITRVVNSGSWTVIRAVIDIAPTATAGELDLALHGSGTAWFSDIEVEAVGGSPSPAAVTLSPQQVANLVTFSRAAAPIRYLHPSDQAAEIDWNAFLPTAIGRVLRVTSSSELLSELRATFSEISPTATFSKGGDPTVVLTPPRGDGTQLARWRRVGLGASSSFPFREGRDHDSTAATALTTLDLADLNGCKELTLHATGHKLPGTGKASLFMRVLLPGAKKQDTMQPFSTSNEDVVLTSALPTDMQRVEIGVRAE